MKPPKVQETAAPSSGADRLTQASRLAAWMWNLTLPVLFHAPIVTWREMWALLSLIGLAFGAHWPQRHRNASPKR